ncbi:MAG: hypothetical protein AMXMBFR8_21730 [Nevskiales bacterium]
MFGYLVLAYLFTWSIGITLLAARRGWIELGVPEGWEAVSAFGPLLAALFVIRQTEGRAGVWSLLRSMWRWRVAPFWLAFSVASPVVLLAGALLIVRATGGAWPDPGKLVSGPLATSAGVMQLLVVTGLAQGLGEEPGWRGFLLPRLRARFSPLAATLLLFPPWLLWHLPAFLGRPEFGLAQWLGFSAGILAAAVWLTLIWERTQSVLLAILWHMLINVARGVAVAISMPVFFAISALVMAGALVIAVSWMFGGSRHARTP